MYTPSIIDGYLLYINGSYTDEYQNIDGRVLAIDGNDWGVDESV